MNDRALPWAGIAAADGEGVVHVVRAEVDHPADIFWGRDWRGQPAFVLGLPGSRDFSLPGSTREIEVSTREEGGRSFLRLILCSDEAEELFMKLCVDLLDSTRNELDPGRRFARMMLRLDNWMDLLGRDAERGLSGEEVRGLFAELGLLRKAVGAGVPPDDAVEAWFGPDRFAQDFQFDRCTVEVKSTGRRRPGSIRVSSEHQLQSGDMDLFVYVVSLAEAADGASLLDRVAEVRKALAEARATSALNEFEERLARTGFVPHDRYAHPLLVEAEAAFHKVTEEFPRLCPENLSPGITGVRYDLALAAISNFRVNDEEALSRMMS